jgi:hypothetical protein
MFAPCGEPDFFRQRLQWQYWNAANGRSIANATAPHKQDPAMLIVPPA